MIVIDNSLKNKSGIYKLTIKNKIYIGSTVDLKRRIQEHYYRLNSTHHHNPYLQNLYNKYKKMSYEVLEFCDVEVMLKQEEYYISLYPECINHVRQPTLFHQEIFGLKVQKLSTFGEYIRKYDSVNRLSDELNVNASTISEAIRIRGYYLHNFNYYTKLGEKFDLAYKSKMILLLINEVGEVSDKFESKKHLCKTYNVHLRYFNKYIDTGLLYDDKYIVTISYYIKKFKSNYEGYLQIL